jgi:pantoate--beta-alanine ligase
MEVFTSISELKGFLFRQRSQNKSVGLVPTMGALHKGHISLLNEAVTGNDVTVCSIFVNPVQFNNAADLEKYPRTLENDCLMLEQAGCSAVFAPSVIEMYAEQPLMTLNFGALESVMEGASRPGHFNGVGIVVSRLFNLVQPDRAYFGQKDLQQVSVIKRLIKDLAFQIELLVCPTIRETDGLAMSSRNTRLDAGERAAAPFIYKTLSEARKALINGKSTANVNRDVEEAFLTRKEFSLDYFSIVDINSLLPVEIIGPSGTNALCIAAFLGPVRLIDNIIF